jgi:hypothetical protein
MGSLGSDLQIAFRFEEGMHLLGKLRIGVIHKKVGPAPKHSAGA